MKSKRLLVLIAIVAIMLVVLICLSALLTVRKVLVVYHNFDGSETMYLEGAPTEAQVLTQTEGKNILFLSKQNTLQSLETNDWHAYAMVKSFPNKVTVHFIKKQLAVKLTYKAQTIYLDSNGYVMSEPADTNLLDITSAFGDFDIVSMQQNQLLKFGTAQNDLRLQKILKAVSAMWQCKVEFNNIAEVLKPSFSFQSNGDMTITMASKAKIVVVEDIPLENIDQCLIDAFSAYFNPDRNLQYEGAIITVRKDGSISLNP